MVKRCAILLGMLLAAGCGTQTEVASLPVADAGFDQVVTPGSEARLDGGASHDPNGADLTYAWTLLVRPTGSSADLIGETTVQAKLTPDVAGRYVASLTVSNGSRESLPDTVAVTARSTSAGIVADAACVGGCEVAWGDTAQVSEVNTAGAAGSYTYAWTQIKDAGTCATDCPEITNCTPLTDGNWVQNAARVASFTAPCALGSLVLRVTVTDTATSESDSDCVELTTTNTPPVAKIRANGLTSLGEINDTETFTLFDNGSDDPDKACLNSIVSREWVQQEPATPLATILNPTGYSTAVTLPNITGPTHFTFALIVFDGDAFSATPCLDLRSPGGCGVEVDVLDVN